MPQQIKVGYRQLVDAANREVETLSATDAVALAGNDNVVFVDLRDSRELDREGRMPGAFHCPRGMLEFWIDPESPYARPIFQEDRKFVFYCASGWRSALSTKTAATSAAHLSAAVRRKCPSQMSKSSSRTCPSLRWAGTGRPL